MARAVKPSCACARRPDTSPSKSHFVRAARTVFARGPKGGGAGNSFARSVPDKGSSMRSVEASRPLMNHRLAVCSRSVPTYMSVLGTTWEQEKSCNSSAFSRRSHCSRRSHRFSLRAAYRVPAPLQPRPKASTFQVRPTSARKARRSIVDSNRSRNFLTHKIKAARHESFRTLPHRGFASVQASILSTTMPLAPSM